jgi:hypothetical protein
MKSIYLQVEMPLDNNVTLSWLGMCDGDPLGDQTYGKCGTSYTRFDVAKYDNNFTQ